MGTLDAQGIWQYDGTDSMVPHATYSNLLATSVSNAFAALLADIDTTLDDTGWVNLTMVSPWVATVGQEPSIRRFGPMVSMRGTATRTATTGNVNVATIPTTAGLNFLPTMDVEGLGYAGSGAFYRGFVNTSGTVNGNNFSGTTFRFSIFGAWFN
jgi:hypothetical protein